VNFKERNMGLIIKVAQLALCAACRGHGYILFGDGTESEKFDSIESASAVVKSAQKADKITEAEAEYLLAGISESNIPTQKQLEKEEALLDRLRSLGHPFEHEPEQERKPTLH
jgi:hypothetical protein